MVYSRSSLVSSIQVVMICAGLFACDSPATADKKFPDSITIAEVVQYPGAQLLDVRSDREWNAGHLQGAMHLPVSDIDLEAAKALPRDKPLIVYCAAGVRASRAVDKLRELGFTAIVVRDGGFSELKTVLRPIH